MWHKITAIFLALCFVFTMSVTAFANEFDVDKTGSISIELIGQDGKTPVSERKQESGISYTSTPRNFFARTPTMKLITATLMLMTAISRKRDLKGSSWATEV